MEKLIKLIEYIDNHFEIEKVEIDEWGKYGAHYIGCCYDYLFYDSIFSVDFIDINDYFIDQANFRYETDQRISSLLEDKSISEILEIIEAIMNLLEKSSYRKNESKEILKKCTGYLNRIGIIVNETNGSFKLNNKIVLFSGSYSDVISFNENSYKKKLKDTYAKDPQWRIRFNREFDNMQQLSYSDYVLKVYNYDKNEDSYLMEICECDLADYLEKNAYSLTDIQLLEIVNDILEGMIDVHSAGIIHRDLHLGNILRKDGHFILADFGLSKDMMKINTLKSSSTPKNSHMFMDPVGRTDFTRLDKLSDIYSIGKIIDYITSDRDINRKLIYLIEKCTNRERKNRYQNVVDIKQAMISFIDESTKVERERISKGKVIKGIVDSNVEQYLLDIERNIGIAKYIVENKLYNFGKILIKLIDSSQNTLMQGIKDNYASATGYNGFANYEIFSTIMFEYINDSSNDEMKKIALSVLKGCAGYRFNSAEQLEKILSKYPELKQ